MAHDNQSVERIDVVIVDSDAVQRRVLAGLIADNALSRYQPFPCASPEEAATSGRDMSRAIILADIETIGGPGHIAEIAGSNSRLIATSSAGSLNVALAAVKAGAFDFLPKPIGAKALIQGLEAAVSSWNSAPSPAPARPAEVKPAPEPHAAPAAGPSDFAGFVGRSPAMLAVYEQIRRMAPSRAPVFITGESGTG
ncbi:MAG: response regulator, partial [Bauldia sp.]|nr:response regulator [Bauldia sp.]